MTRALHVVEPTLVDSRGHCRSLLHSFCAAAPEVTVTVWGGRAAPADILPLPNVRLVPWFDRRLRVLRSYLLYRRLFRGEDTVWVPTAGRTDIVLVDRALGRSAPTERAVLFVHWLRPTRSRMRALRSVARRRPEMRLLGATASVARLLQECGFHNAVHVPYPVTSSLHVAEAGGPFSHLLYAGAARRDKGFHRFVDLVDALTRAGATWPVVTQTGGDYYDRMDDAVRRDLERLSSLGYRPLRTEPGGLDRDAYLALYRGAVAVQFYAPDQWQDRASGVTLDALSAAAPILTFSGSWMARQAERFGAGLAVDPEAPETWLEAADRLVRHYARFSAAAATAGSTLAREYHPQRLVDAVLG